MGFTALKHNICYTAPLSEVSVITGAHADLVNQPTFYMGLIWAPYGFLYGRIWAADMGPMPRLQPVRSWDPYGQPRYISMALIRVIYFIMFFI